MKLRVIAAVVAASVLLAGCARPAVICGKTYDTYGLFNEGQKRNPNIEYRANIGSVILGIIFFETLIAPIYIFGFSLMEPVRPLSPETERGVLSPPGTCK
jgi:hypothetical protein